MIKSMLTVVATVCFMIVLGQNVGIGTTSPQSKLEVRNAVKSTIRIRSNNFNDTAQLILSNRSATELGTDFNISSNRETGLKISSTSDLPANNHDSILMLTPGGNVGINRTTPTERLDVNGNINLNGNLKLNGIAGQANQLIMTDGAGATVWKSMNEYPNFRIFRRIDGFSQTFTVPAGITKLFIELWGGGGGGSSAGGGGGGGYAAVVVPCAAGQLFSIFLGAGGAPGNTETAAASNGGSTTVSRAPSGINIVAGGGYGSNGFSGEPGASADVFESTGSVSSVFYVGTSGFGTKESYAQRSSTEFLTIRNYGDGGGSGMMPNTGGPGGFKSFITATLAAVKIIQPPFSSEPGGGGGGGPNGLIWGAYGAPGMVIIRY